MNKTIVYELTKEELDVLEHAWLICDNLIYVFTDNNALDSGCDKDLFNGISELKDLYHALNVINNKIVNLKKYHTTNQEDE